MKTRSVVDPRDQLFHVYVEMPDGREVAFFLNTDTGLIVVDVVDADGEAGVELYRRHIDQ